MEKNTELDTLLSNEELLTLSEVAEELGIAVTRVHDLLHAKKLIAYIRDGERVKYFVCGAFGLSVYR